MALGMLVAIGLELYSVFADKSGKRANNRRRFEEPKSALISCGLVGMDKMVKDLEAEQRVRAMRERADRYNENQSRADVVLEQRNLQGYLGIGD
ncbi:hypothetical protein C1I72_00950 [Ehrlichia canis]|nr:hypothetical protein C1I72_00950 [Ehrlichia canis]